VENRPGPFFVMEIEVGDLYDGIEFRHKTPYPMIVAAG
jgi:hypothetical protein